MRHVSIAAVALMIASCQGQEDVGNRGNVTNAAAAASDKQNVVPTASDMIQPGEWESRVVSIHMKFEPVVTRQGKLELDDDKPNPPKPYRLCVTEEKSKELFKNYRTGRASGVRCSQANFTMKEGRIHGTLVCTVQGEKSERQLEGRYTPTSYEATEVTRTRITTPPSDGVESTKVPMTMTRQMSARRIGDCPPAS